MKEKRKISLIGPDSICYRACIVQRYLVSDLDEQEEHDEDEQVVKDADSSDDDVDDLERKVTDVGQIRREIIVRLRRGRRDVDPNIIRRRCVVHRRHSSLSSVVVNCLYLTGLNQSPATSARRLTSLACDGVASRSSRASTKEVAVCSVIS